MTTRTLQEPAVKTNGRKRKVRSRKRSAGATAGQCRRKFLAIGNPGVASVEGLTILGVSTSRDNPKLIGTFGSGFMQAVNLLSRKGVSPTVYCGELKVQFSHRPLEVGGRTFRHATAKLNGTDEKGRSFRGRTKQLGYTLDHGAVDWTNVDMALREIVANAVDGSVRNGGSHNDVTFDWVNKPEKKSGRTTVFVPATDEVRDYFADLSSRFLHFSDREVSTIMEKDERGPGKIYKNQVFVRDTRVPSVYDYNLGADLELDECRNSDEHDARRAVCRAVLSHKNPAYLAEIMRRVRDDSELFEADFCPHIMRNYRIRMATAFRLAFGENAVICGALPAVAEHVKRKGFVPVILAASFDRVLRLAAVKSDVMVLNGAEAAGHDTYDATPQMHQTVEAIWGMLEDFRMTNGKGKPDVRAFAPLMEGESQTYGLYKDETVYLHTDLAGKGLYKVALEEVSHHVTAASDMSRDFQDFLLRLVTEVAR